MVAKNDMKFRSDEFVIEVIAKGDFTDNCFEDKPFLVEAYSIRLNSTALKMWQDGQESESIQKRVSAQIVADLDLDESKGSVTIAHVVSEVFSIVYMREMPGLIINPVNGNRHIVRGKRVTYKDFVEDGRIYYCGGRSFPAEIVEAVI